MYVFIYVSKVKVNVKLRSNIRDYETKPGWRKYRKRRKEKKKKKKEKEEEEEEAEKKEEFIASNIRSPVVEGEVIEVFSRRAAKLMEKMLATHGIKTENRPRFYKLLLLRYDMSKAHKSSTQFRKPAKDKVKQTATEWNVLGRPHSKIFFEKLTNDELTITSRTSRH